MVSCELKGRVEDVEMGGREIAFPEGLEAEGSMDEYKSCGGKGRRTVMPS